jgi:propanol-preferring alcohol dehydrogenase
LSALRRKGTISLNGLPPGSFDLPIFATVINGYTVRGSIVGTRKDMQEAVAFAVEGKVKTTVHTAKMENINSVFDDMKKGEIDGRIVLDIATPASLHNLLAQEKTGKTPTALTLS